LAARSNLGRAAGELDCPGLRPGRHRSRALEILGALVERRGNIVSKEEIMGTGWPRTVVAEGNLFVQTAALRQILGAAQPGQSCTQTEIGRVIDLSRR
jgi:DNA-binding winged helix-turn-helix (wHTH) protein